MKKEEKLGLYTVDNSRNKPQNGRKTNKKSTLKNQKAALIVIICLTVVFAGVSAYLFSATIAKGIAAANDAYSSSRVDTEKSVYQMFYDAAEARYHVRNEEAISVDNIREKANLEVLKVCDVEYIIQEGDKNNKGITSWLEVPGEGMFTVDLETSEFIVDNQHRHITARIPNPVLSECRVIYQDVVTLEFKNNAFHDSIRDGEDLAKKQLNEAYMKIMTEFTSNPKFFLAARSSAEKMVVNLIKSVNPDIPDLTVEVDFID